MKAFISIAIFLLFALPGSGLFAQNVTTHEVEPVGVYKQISNNITGDVNIAKLLMDTVNTDKSKLIDSVERNANHFIPPVLYVLSGVLYSEQKYNDAAFWFYVAQLRARYDVNRCLDKTASAVTYNQTFGPAINEYAFKHLDTLASIIPKVIAFVKGNEELYDYRWINLGGMQAMTESLGGNSPAKPLSADRDKWAAIKQTTVDSYYSDFKEALANYRKKQ